MSVEPSLNNSNMVVAEIINEINSTQPSGNYSQNTRATPIQRTQVAPQQQQQQQRATPFRRQAQKAPQQQAQQVQQVQQAQQVQQQKRPTPPTQRRPRKRSFINLQKKQMKKVKFNDKVEERIISDESESESESEDTTPLEEIVLKSSKKNKVSKNKKESKENTKPKFLKKDDVQETDLNETKGFYTKLIHFFTNDTKEPLLVLTLVFAISMPVVNRLMGRFLPFLMKYGEGSLYIVGIKALVVALVFFAIKKLLL